MPKLSIKNRHQETRLFRRRLLITIASVVMLISLLLGRLIDLQLINYHQYATDSQDNLLNIIPLAPSRGLIFDRKGRLLAENLPTYSVDIIPDKVKNLPATLDKLQSLFQIPTSQITHFQKNLPFDRPFEAIPLVYNPTQQQLAQFYVNRYLLPGVIVSAKLIRHYPEANASSDVVGYVGRITASDLKHVNTKNYAGTNFYGKRGIENYYEKILHGTVGEAEVEINARGKIIHYLHKKPPIAGDNLYLTIDTALQKVAAKAFGKDAGAVVAIQPSTGQILAMVTNPSYNPNPFVIGISAKQYHHLLYAPQHPLYNRAINGEYAPGSTVKPFYSLAALSLGVITPRYKIFDPGYYIIPGTRHVFHNWDRNGNGWVNVVKAIYVSCDTFFYELAVKLGIKRIDKILTRFGFGQPTGIDFPNASVGLVPTPHWKMGVKGHPWYTGDTVNLGIGQGYMLVTPVQLAHAVTIIAERGKEYRPTLLLKTITPGGQTHVNLPDLEGTITLKDPNAWNVVINGMHQVITNPQGTGWHFGRHPGYSVAAKTGTAQVYGDYRDEDNVQWNLPKRLRDNHLFIAFAPIKHPLIAIAVVAEHDDRASTIARKVMDYYLLTQHHLKATSHAQSVS